MTIINTLVEKFPVRRSKEQKEAFRAWAVEQAKSMGYQAQVEAVKDHHNVVIGDPETAQAIFTAHYDTPAGFFLPNLMTPRNKLVFWLRQVWMILVLILIGVAVGVPVGMLAGNGDIGFEVGWLVYMGCLFVMLMGPANKNNVNDNTSGVAAVFETMARIPEEDRAKAAFILFDNEEKGLLGSKAYAKAHPAVKESGFIVNLDCVGDGDHILFFPTKKAKQNEVKIVAEAKEEAARIISRANAEVDLEKKRALDDMKQEMITIASMMAEKVVGDSIDADVQDKLFEDTLQEMGEHTWRN